MQNEVLIAEYDDRDEGTRRAETYGQIEWLRYELKRKPGWSAITFKDLFGQWPPPWMKTLTPIEPSAMLRKLVRKRDNAFKRQMRKANGNAGTALHGSRAAI